MARQLRIEYPGAYYHIKSRGNQRQPIFFSDDDRYFFLACLADAHARFAVTVHVYCLMTNHYHLFIKTPRANLSRSMHLINTRYSIYLNTKHERCGHPFQGRFKAILVEAEAYACELSRYIHLNPVRAGMVRMPEDYEWSNYREHLGLRNQPLWMDTAFVLSFFGSPLTEARERYAEFVLSGIGQTLKNPLSAAESSGILGSEAFVERIKKAHLREKMLESDREIPELRRLKAKPGLAKIKDEVERYLGARNKHARRATIFITHKNTDYTLKQIGEFFHLGPSGISSACRKMRCYLAGNDSLSRAVTEIERRIFYSPVDEVQGLARKKWQNEDLTPS